MSRSNELQRLGAVAFVVAATCSLAAAIAEHAAGVPPRDAARMLAWAASAHVPLVIVSELSFFAATPLLAGAAALFVSLSDTARARATFGCSLLAAAVPLWWAAIVAHGRVVYPVFGLGARTPETAELCVALYYGGMHVVLLLFAVATVPLALAMRRGPLGGAIASVGLVAAACDVAAAYPDHLGPHATLACRAVAAAWLALVGVGLWRSRDDGAQPA